MSEKIIVYPISANPPTWGHADIMMRAAKHFDHLYWVAASNPNKKYMFTEEERIEMTMIKPLELDWREVKVGDTVKGKVVRLEKFGAFVEIGAERPGLVHISEMAHGYVKVPSDVIKEGEEVEAQIIDVNRRKKQIKLSIKAIQPEPEVVVTERPAPTPASPRLAGCRG